MTDARFPDRWLSDKRIQRLSDSHFRAFMTSLAWSVSNMTDGRIEPEDLALIPNFAAGSAKSFVAAGLWAPLEIGWLITVFEETQTTAAELRAAAQHRVKEREKKAAQRAKKAAEANPEDNDDAPASPGTGGGTSPGTSKARPRQDKPREGESPKPELFAVNGGKAPSTFLENH